MVLPQSEGDSGKDYHNRFPYEKIEEKVRQSALGRDKKSVDSMKRRIQTVKERGGGRIEI